MIVPTPEFISNIHRILLELASLIFTILCLVRLCLGEIRSMRRPPRRKKPPTREVGFHG